MSEKILIVDDHDLFRAGVRELICSVFLDATTKEANSYESAQRALEEESNLSLLLTDLSMPGMDGFRSLRALIDLAPGIPFVVMSASTSPDDIRRCFDCGVMGYIPKAESSPVISKALQLVLSGGVYVPPLILSTESRCGSSANALAEKLTKKQNTVLECMVKGRSNKEIAGELHMSVATVKAHITSIFRNLNVRNRTQAILYVNQQACDAYAFSAAS